jgi:hypothetical protein
MTWSYSGDPSASNKDEVRYLTGDTDTTDQLVTDEEINYAISSEANNILAAARTAQAIASKFSRKADKSVGDLNITYSQQTKAYQDLEKKLREMAVKQGSATAYCGGISISDKQTVETDTDRTSPIFERGEFNNQGSDDPNNIIPYRTIYYR